jgi:hypothetical protein
MNILIRQIELKNDRTKVFILIRQKYIKHVPKRHKMKLLSKKGRH